MIALISSNSRAICSFWMSALHSTLFTYFFTLFWLRLSILRDPTTIIFLTVSWYMSNYPTFKAYYLFWIMIFIFVIFIIICIVTAKFIIIVVFVMIVLIFMMVICRLVVRCLLEEWGRFRWVVIIGFGKGVTGIWLISVKRGKLIGIGSLGFGGKWWWWVEVGVMLVIGWWKIGVTLWG